MRKIILLASIVLALSSCDFPDFPKGATTQFADQHFKTAIANIELYKIRHGRYPNDLKSLDFLGDWDTMIFESLEYEKLDTGYRLDVVKGMGVIDTAPPKLKYPEEFWQGLGLKKSNVLDNSK